MKNPRLSIIAAVAENLAIGKDNQLLWHISEDLKRFKSLTTGHVVVMGQKTFESIGKPLPNRTNIILSDDPEYKMEGAMVVHSIDEALTKANQVEREEIFVIGGGYVYKQFLPLADRLYITKVKGDFDADSFFPKYDEFSKIVSSEKSFDDNHEYEFLILERDDKE